MWQGILGHDSIAEQFRATLARGRLASSYLFVGPEGIGKRTFALKLAEVLLCSSFTERRRQVGESSQELPLEPCGQCESCRLLSAGNHPDLYELSRPAGKQSLPMELFIGDRAHRNQTGLCHQIAMRPMLGRRRVAIIDDADYLRQESANCLLKTLEEPPAGSLLILIGTSRSRQLPTILSRTQVVRFKSLSEEDLSQLLQQQLGTEEAALLAASSEGSLAIANQYSQGRIAELRERLLPQLTGDRFCSVRLAKELGQFVNDAGKEALLRRQRLRAILRLVTDHFRGQLRASCQKFGAGAGQAGRFKGAGINERSASNTNLTADRQVASRASQEQALAVLQRCVEADQQLERNANQATLLASWLDDLATELTGP